MAIKRVLEREGRQITWTVDGVTLTVNQPGKPATTETLRRDFEAADRLIALTRTKLDQGWVPTTKPKDVGKFTSALNKVRLQMWQWIVGLTDDEVTQAYRTAIKDEEDVSLGVLRRRPTRELFAYMLTRFDKSYEPDWTKAVKFLSKDPAQAAWINEELQTALKQGTLPTDRAKKFAERNSKKIAAGPKAAPVVPAKATGDEGSLLDAIAKKPADDAPRMVYADWLLERGNGWGEYIQASCEYAPLDFGDRRNELKERLKKLENKHSKAWLAPIRGFIRNWEFERGLLGRVTCDAATFVKAADAIILRAPRATIELTGLKKKDVAALAKTRLGAFATVMLSSQRIEDDGMKAIAASPGIAGATSWNLGHNSFGDDGVEAIAHSPHFASATELDLSAFTPQFTSRGLTALLASPHLANLTSLSVAFESPGPAFATCTLRKLQYLTLSTANFTNDDAVALSKVAGFNSLDSLSIHQLGNEPLKLDDKGVRAILSKFPKLRSLSTTATLRADTQALIDKRAALPPPT